MGVRYICPRCRTDLMAHLSWDLDKCPSCGVPLVRSRARFAFVKHELQQGIYIGFLCAFATAVLMAVAAGVVGRLGAALPAFVVAPAGVVFFVAPILYYWRVFRPTRRPTDPPLAGDRSREVGDARECYLCGNQLAPEELASRVCRPCST